MRLGLLADDWFGSSSIKVSCTSTEPNRSITHAEQAETEITALVLIGKQKQRMAYDL